MGSDRHKSPSRLLHGGVLLLVLVVCIGFLHCGRFVQRTEVCFPTADVGACARALNTRTSSLLTRTHARTHAQLGATAQATHLVHRVSQGGTGIANRGAPAELRQYDNILTLPRLNSKGQVEVRRESM